MPNKPKLQRPESPKPKSPTCISGGHAARRWPLHWPVDPPATRHWQDPPATRHWHMCRSAAPCKKGGSHTPMAACTSKSPGRAEGEGPGQRLRGQMARPTRVSTRLATRKESGIRRRQRARRPILKGACARRRHLHLQGWQSLHWPVAACRRSCEKEIAEFGYLRVSEACFTICAVEAVVIELWVRDSWVGDCCAPCLHVECKALALFGSRGVKGHTSGSLKIKSTVPGCPGAVCQPP